MALGPASSCPPPALVKEVLSNVQRLTFYGFLVALSKHHGINQALGKPEPPWRGHCCGTDQGLPAPPRCGASLMLGSGMSSIRTLPPQPRPSCQVPKCSVALGMRGPAPLLYLYLGSQPARSKPPCPLSIRLLFPTPTPDSHRCSCARDRAAAPGMPLSPPLRSPSPARCSPQQKAAQEREPTDTSAAGSRSGPPAASSLRTLRGAGQALPL